ncbi:hypothetical protein FKM82_005608 [Ascaphus truei]
MSSLKSYLSDLRVQKSAFIPCPSCLGSYVRTVSKISTKTITLSFLRDAASYIKLNCTRRPPQVSVLYLHTWDWLFEAACCAL